MPGLQPQSLVSLWCDSERCSEEQFVCSGVIVGNGLILTVAHAFDGGGELWARPFVDATHAYPLKPKRTHHDTLDAALARIDAMPAAATVAPVNPHGRAQLNMKLYLNGYRKGGYEAPHDTDYLCFEPKDRRHIISTKQPAGHSGSGVSHDDELWGIAFAHYTDANVHRGCVISCGQLWDGFLADHVALPVSKLVNLGVVQPFEVDKVSRSIRKLLAENDFKAANTAMLDFANGHGNDEELVDATVLSMTITEFLRHSPSLQENLDYRKQLATGMIKLVNKIMRRLLGGPT